MRDIEMILLRCEKCGGIMIPKQDLDAYECRYCRNLVPFTDENYYRHPPIRYRHHKIEVDGEYFNVLHTGVTWPVEIKTPLWLSRDVRKEDLDQKLKRIGSEVGYVTIGKVEFECPNCGGQVEGDETQNIYTCPYCDSKIGKEKALRPGSYKLRYIMGLQGQKQIPGRAIPFSVTHEQAVEKLRYLISVDPILSSVRDLDRYMDTALHAFYLPFSLMDMSIQVDCRGLLSSSLYYKEYLNWACPKSVLHDVYVTDRLDPWDFSENIPFDPSFMDGNTRIVGMSNLFHRGELMDCLMYDRLMREIKEDTGQEPYFHTWGTDYRKHGEFVLLPVYWADMRDFDGKCICGAVNGQTGKPVIQILGSSNREDYIAEGEPSMWMDFSADSSMDNKAIRIEMAKGSIKWAKKR